MPQYRFPLKSYHYRPQGKRTVGRPKKRWREQLQLWRRNEPNGPTLVVVVDDDDEIKISSTLTHIGVKMGVLSCSNLTADNLATLFTVRSCLNKLSWKHAVVLLNK
jgi:hypothetical protein